VPRFFDDPGHQGDPPQVVAPAGPRPRRYMTALLAVVVVGLLTREAIIVPFTVGYAAARRLVEQEDQEAALHKQVAEYQAATEFYRTQAGQEAAGRLLLNVPGPGERRAVLKPEAPSASPKQNVRGTLSDLEARVTQAMHFQMRVFHRWAHDPPRQEPVKTPGDKTKQPQKAPPAAN
jgi:hypothetical protein